MLYLLGVGRTIDAQLQTFNLFELATRLAVWKNSPQNNSVFNLNSPGKCKFECGTKIAVNFVNETRTTNARYITQSSIFNFDMEL